MKHQDWGGYEGQVCVDPQETWTGGKGRLQLVPCYSIRDETRGLGLREQRREKVYGSLHCLLVSSTLSENAEVR